MANFIKICPKCGASNEPTMDYCVDCGEHIKLVIPTEAVEENTNEPIQGPRFYKQCRVCGAKNYVESKAAFLNACSTCGNEDINETPTLEEIVEKAPEIKVGFTDSEGKFIRITKDSVIGRYGDVEPEYFQKNQYVSGNHLKIFKENDEYYIIDLGSLNGTYLNECKLNPNMRYRITDGAKLVLANLELTFNVYED